MFLMGFDTVSVDPPSDPARKGSELSPLDFQWAESNVKKICIQLPNEIRSDAPEDSDSIPSISSPEATPSKQLPYERAQSTPPFVVKSPKPKRRLLPTVNFRLPKDLNKQNGETPTNQPPTTSVDSSDGDEEASPMLPPTSTTTPNDAAPPSTEPHVGIEVPSAPPEIDNVPVIPFRTKSNPRLQVKPAYIDDAHRQFWNPISYLGGPHLLPRDRNSITSVLSLD